MGLNETKKFLCSKGNNQQNEMAVYVDWKKIFANHIPHKELTSKICKNLYNSMIEK